MRGNENDSFAFFSQTGRIAKLYKFVLCAEQRSSTACGRPVCYCTMFFLRGLLMQIVAGLFRHAVTTLLGRESPFLTCARWLVKLHPWGQGYSPCGPLFFCLPARPPPAVQHTASAVHRGQHTAYITATTREPLAKLSQLEVTKLLVTLSWPASQHTSKYINTARHTHTHPQARAHTSAHTHTHMHKS